MRHLLCRISLFNCCRGVTTNDDRRSAGASALSKSFNNRVSAPCKGRHLSNSKRTVPYNGLRVCQDFTESLNRFWADIHDTPALGNSVVRNNLVLCIGGETVGHHDIDWQHECDPTLLRLLDQVTRHVSFALFHQLIAHLAPL